MKTFVSLVPGVDVWDGDEDCVVHGSWLGCDWNLGRQLFCVPSCWTLEATVTHLLVRHMVLQDKMCHSYLASVLICAAVDLKTSNILVRHHNISFHDFNEGGVFWVKILDGLFCTFSCIGRGRKMAELFNTLGGNSFGSKEKGLFFLFRVSGNQWISVFWGLNCYLDDNNNMKSFCSLGNPDDRS